MSVSVAKLLVSTSPTKPEPNLLPGPLSLSLPLSPVPLPLSSMAWIGP